ncbi:MAG: aldo/keto reductase, partial [Planctomycetota bacterium]
MGDEVSQAGRGGASGALPRRPYGRTGVELSILGFGGIVVMGHEQAEANKIVAEAFERGVNYFDVAPSYGEGEAEEKLGPALKPFRDEVFLACKSDRRTAAEAQHQLEQSLDRLHTDHFDLYQFHGVTSLEDVERIFAPGGAAETFVAAREKGVVHHLGFSAHSTQAALAMLDRFEFDSILFPINYVCYAQGGFGAEVVARARERGAARLAIKALAHTVRDEGYDEYSKLWYRPIEDASLAQQALRFTLSEDITAAVSSGDVRLLRL